MGATCAAESQREEFEVRGSARGSSYPETPSPLKCCTRPNRQLSTGAVDDQDRDGVQDLIHGDSHMADACSSTSTPQMPSSWNSSGLKDVGAVVNQPEASRKPVEDPSWRKQQDAMFDLLGVPEDKDPEPRALDSAVNGYVDGNAAANSRKVDSAYDPGGFWQAEQDYLAAAEDEEPEDPQAIAAREREDVLHAMIRESKPLYTVPEHLRSDKEVVLAAIGNEGAFCVDYIESKELKERDRDVGFALVMADGNFLQTVCEAFRADKDFVRAALMTNADALKYAAPQLQTDKELKAIAASRTKEESRLMKVFEAKCGPAMTGCISTSRFSRRA